MAMQPIDPNDPKSNEVSKEQLYDDLRQLSQTVEELMQATADDSRENVSKLRERAELRLNEARERLSQKGEVVREQAMEKFDCADHYVHENPWSSVGIAAGVGVVVGLLLGRR
ncbi:MULTISPECIES: DUF883 family protein [Larsenimonas]|uniref:DUF883 family protein n=1 Tax=Larsenimonas suaedae TaxID=1851019 RepID=A0ABU1GXV2_9GAMM|nr:MULTISPECIES: DUF883 family protein [Larsenimonas]MCM2972785.1 DUF883 family protein [Larsenimonas suaedae]MCM5705737.1 DUF883 family protein [Larsenimonas salina]MDR5896884.1 DUF883 family protein [Larsenimonas suaedae]